MYYTKDVIDYRSVETGGGGRGGGGLGDCSPPPPPSRFFLTSIFDQLKKNSVKVKKAQNYKTC